MSGSGRFRSTSGLKGCCGSVISTENGSRTPQSSASSRLSTSASTAGTPNSTCFIMPGPDRAKAPNPNHRAPEKLQSPIIKARTHLKDISRLSSTEVELEVNRRYQEQEHDRGMNVSYRPFVSGRRLT